MDIQYQLIKTTQEKINLFKFRKQVFVDEEKRLEIPLDHITDLYDSIEETRNLAAYANGQLIAALRVTGESPAGLPVDQHWDFKGFRAGLDGPCSSFGWLCCAKAFRGRNGLIKTLVGKGAEQALKLNSQYLVAVVHPPLFDLLHHCFGARQIGGRFLDPYLNVEMIPIHARVQDILDRMPSALKNQGICRSKTANAFLHGKNDSGDRLKDVELQGKFHFLEQAWSRNIGIFSMAEQEKLIDARIAVPGLGGVGGQHLVTLARMGIGKFNIADFDSFEPKNMNRQYGAKTTTLDLPKIDVMAKEALDINPFLDIRQFPAGVTMDNIDDFLDGVDLVADGMDFFNMDIRRLIFTRAREKKIPVITAGPLGFSSALLVFMPNSGMTFDEYFNISDDLTLEEKLIRFFVGLAPRATQAAYIDPVSISMAEQRGPSTGGGCQICSGVVAAETARILLSKKGIKPAPHYCQYDPFTRQFHQAYLFRGNRHPLQRIKIWAVKKRLATSMPVMAPVCPDRMPDANHEISGSIINYIINAGCQAPSGDNCQPWIFDYAPPVLKIYMNPGADTSFFNVNQTASRIACGAAIENCLVAATRFDICATPALVPDPDQPDLVADLELTPGHIEESPLARFIWERHTNRTPFTGQPIPDQDIKTLHDSLDPFPRARLKLITAPSEISQIARLIYGADMIRSQRRDLHTHLMEMIRFTREEALLKKDGLPLKNLEAGILGDLFLKLCRSWTMMGLANQAGMGKSISRLAAKWVRQGSAIGLLTVDGNTPKDEIIGGQALERIWLTASRQGISFQPMTAITLFRLRWDLGQQNQFSMAHQQLLGRLWPLYDQLFDTQVGKSPIMLFRLGYGGKVSCRTLRHYQGAL